MIKAGQVVLARALLCLTKTGGIGDVGTRADRKVIKGSRLGEIELPVNVRDSVSLLGQGQARKPRDLDWVRGYEVEESGNMVQEFEFIEMSQTFPGLFNVMTGTSDDGEAIDIEENHRTCLVDTETAKV